MEVLKGRGPRLLRRSPTSPGARLVKAEVRVGHLVKAKFRRHSQGLTDSPALTHLPTTEAHLAPDTTHGPKERRNSQAGQEHTVPGRRPTWVPHFLQKSLHSPGLDNISFLKLSSESLLH